MHIPRDSVDVGLPMRPAVMIKAARQFEVKMLSAGYDACPAPRFIAGVLHCDLPLVGAPI